MLTKNLNPRSAGANYKRLAAFLVAVDATPDNHFTFHAGGYMPLSLEYLYDAMGGRVYSLMHYYTQNGDLMRDPDMTFVVSHDEQKIIPLTYQQDGCPFSPCGTLYQEVFDGPDRYRPGLLRELDSFLALWTKNILHQGFDPQEAAAPQ